MPSSPDQSRAKRFWRRLGGDRNKLVADNDTAVNNTVAPGNTPQAPPGAAAVALPPLIVVPGAPGYAALALMAVPVAFWALMVWLSTKHR